MRTHRLTIYTILSIALLSTTINAQELTKHDVRNVAKQCRLELNADCYEFCSLISCARCTVNDEDAQKCIALSKHDENPDRGKTEHIPVLISTIGRTHIRHGVELLSEERPDLKKRCLWTKLDGTFVDKDPVRLIRGVRVKLTDVKIVKSFNKGKTLERCTVGKTEILN